MKLAFPRWEGGVHPANAMAAGLGDAGGRHSGVWQGEAGHR